MLSLICCSLLALLAEIRPVGKHEDEHHPSEVVRRRVGAGTEWDGGAAVHVGYLRGAPSGVNAG